MMVPTPDDQTLIIGTQLRAARESMGFSLGDAAASLNVSSQTLAEWEEGVSEPVLDVVWGMSELYGRAIDYFLRPTSDAPVQSSFRISNVRHLPELAPTHRQVLIRFEEICRAHTELEEMLGIQQAPRMEKVHLRLTAADLAEQQRNTFGLGNKPVRHLRTVLEEAGVKIFHLPVPDNRFSGFSWWHQEYGPGILINASDNAGRRNFTTAHELAHLLVDDRSVICDLLMDVEDERYANIFAANFLMPVASLKAALELPDRSSFDDGTLGQVASDYGVSLEALGRRLEDIEMLPAGTTDQRIQEWERQRSFFRGSTTPVWQRRLGVRFTNHALEAYAKGLISLSKLASLLGLDIEKAANFANAPME